MISDCDGHFRSLEVVCSVWQRGSDSARMQYNALKGLVLHHSDLKSGVVGGWATIDSPLGLAVIRAALAGEALGPNETIKDTGYFFRFLVADGVLLSSFHHNTAVPRAPTGPDQLRTARWPAETRNSRHCRPHLAGAGPRLM